MRVRIHGFSLNFHCLDTCITPCNIPLFYMFNWADKSTKTKTKQILEEENSLALKGDTIHAQVSLETCLECI